MASDTLLFTAPVQRPGFDGGVSVSGMKIINCNIDPVSLTATVAVRAIEDGIAGNSHAITVTGLTGATTLLQLLNAVKAQVSAALGVTFQ